MYKEGIEEIDMEGRKRENKGEERGGERRRERGREREREKERERKRGRGERDSDCLTDIWALFPDTLHPLGATLVRR